MLALSKIKTVLFDPLRIFGATSILAYVFLMLSGIVFNPVRLFPATVGIIANIIGQVGSNKRIGRYNSIDIVMGLTFICGIGYIVSGSNLFGYEEGSRVGEMIAGGSICTATVLVIRGKPKLSSIFFLLATFCMSYGAFEVMMRIGKPDWYMLLASFSFFVSNIVAAFIKKQE